MNWPVEDVAKNIRYFLSLVKRATGNERVSLASKDDSASNKPRTCYIHILSMRRSDLVLEYQIVRVMLSSPHGPGVRIADY